MKLWLDECVPRKLKNTLTGHECQTVPDAGLAGKKNGELLALAENAGFEVFVTVDQGIEFEQNLSGRKIAVIVVSAKSSRLADLLLTYPTFWSDLRSSRAENWSASITNCCAAPGIHATRSVASNFVPSTVRNSESHAGWAGHAGAVTRLPSTQALSIGTST